MRTRHLVVAWLLAGATGCASTPPKEMWLTQRQGAMSSPDPQARLQKLAGIAESAAYDGDLAAVKLLLKDLEADPRHDDVAARCATQMAAKSQPDAERVADLIENEPKRAETLAKLRAKKE